MHDPVPTWLRTSASIGWRLLVLAGVAYLATVVLAEIRVLVIPALLSLFVGSLATPVVAWLRSRGVNRLLSTMLAFVGAALVLVGVVAFISGEIAASVDEINASVDEGILQITDYLADGPLGLSAERVDDYLQQAQDSISSNAEQLLGGVAGGAATVLEVVTGFLLMLVFAFFVIKDGDRFWHWLLSYTPDEHRELIHRIGERSWATLRSYLGGTALVGLADALVIGIGLAILGVPLVIPLSLLIFFGAFFPLIGATVSGLAAALVALATVGLTEALIVVAIVLAVQRLEGDILMPILVGKATDMHPLLIIVALTIGFIVAGLVGGFLAVPILAVGIVVVKQVNGARALGDPAPPESQTSV